jgi:alkylation response protein AidB-like acyl-CoA dehydrogenase
MYRLTEEQQRVVQRVAMVADQQVAPHAARVDRDSAFPREAIAALGNGGWLGLTVPQPFGGLGQGLSTMVAALDGGSDVRRQRWCI